MRTWASPHHRPGTVPARSGHPRARSSRSHASRDPWAALRPGCRPRGCRAPARRVLGRRVRYVFGPEPGQVQGRRWRLR
ncbi:tryptophan biosynthesis modulator TrpM [Wenjunlia vitaminophila]|uniref:tryptophan biosynthesis modulator TrpM n=1 Tax=Wenjunlia vitaminophila TaxID=76728 RepID=UPI0009968315